MAQAQVYEGTPDQLVKQLSKLPNTQKYKITVTPEGLEQPQGAGLRRGMFPQLKGLTDEDFKAAEWRGEDTDLWWRSSTSLIRTLFSGISRMIRLLALPLEQF